MKPSEALQALTGIQRIVKTTKPFIFCFNLAQSSFFIARLTILPFLTQNTQFPKERSNLTNIQNLNIFNLFVYFLNRYKFKILCQILSNSIFKKILTFYQCC